MLLMWFFSLLLTVRKKKFIFIRDFLFRNLSHLIRIHAFWIPPSYKMFISSLWNVNWFSYSFLILFVLVSSLFRGSIKKPKEKTNILYSLWPWPCLRVEWFTSFKRWQKNSLITKHNFCQQHWTKMRKNTDVILPENLYMPKQFTFGARSKNQMLFGAHKNPFSWIQFSFFLFKAHPSTPNADDFDVVPFVEKTKVIFSHALFLYCAQWLLRSRLVWMICPMA